MHGSFRFVDSHVYDTLEAQGDVQQGLASWLAIPASSVAWAQAETGSFFPVISFTPSAEEGKEQTDDTQLAKVDLEGWKMESARAA